MSVRKLNNKFNVIGENLKKYRKMKKLSQAGLARKLNLLGVPAHKNDICSIEANKRTVKDYELWGCAKVLEIKLEDLFERSRKKHRNRRLKNKNNSIIIWKK